ncbi:protein phosphatase 1 regulatory subunit 14C-like [Cyprinus carpio]|uniref:Protein phosphatase 1 regulatory subunit 14C-like n=1 Tax=Cyprinus carpio TaxID=7962 RepID=A0A9Q9XQV5_CYPCA|nr:protein phosphatase 1 regulatory subunit 14C-like [Cyprinus carpio]
MSTASAETTAQLPPSAGRVFFQPGVSCASSGPMQRDDPVQKKQGKVTVKYDRKELRKRLILEEWIIEQLSELYNCEVRLDPNRNAIKSLLISTIIDH